MPFAIIAVALLITASSYGAISYLTKESEQNAQDVITELGTIDSMIVLTDNMIEKGLGGMIFEISTDPDGGSLENRKESFERRAGEWLDSTFPRFDKGVSVTMLDHTVTLSIESLKLSDTDNITGGFTPSYLKATGQYTAKYVAASGTSTRTLSINTDGSCALPLVAEQGSLFDNCVTGAGSVLSQMMSQQLTSLAQFRVLNGYGALSEYGEMGTMSILTSADVEEAYRNSIKVLESLTFRNTSDNDWNSFDRIDLADKLITGDGFVELDLSAIYSQALITVMDDLILRWFDYLYGNQMMNLTDSLSDKTNNAWDSLKGFFTGRNEFSAAPYIEAVLIENGYDVNTHRYLMSGKTFEVDIPHSIMEANVAGIKQNIEIPSFRVEIPYPTVDLMAWHDISKFKSIYREDTNEIREWLRNVINSAAVEIGESKALGTIRISVDPHDDISLFEDIVREVHSALEGGNDDINRIMASAISEQRMIDPFYAEIHSIISNNFEEIYGLIDLDGYIRSALRDSIDKGLETHIGKVLDPNVIDILVENALRSDNVRSASSSYRDLALKNMDDLNALKNVPGGQSGVLRDVAIAILKSGGLLTESKVNISNRIDLLCNEIALNEKMGAYDGPIDLPDVKDFVLVDGNGNTSIESLKVTDHLSL